MKKVKLGLVLLASWIPLNVLRLSVYRMLGYKIGKKVKIGFRSILISDNCVIGDNVTIGFKTSINSNTFEVGDGTKIGNNNKFVACSTFKGKYEYANYIKIGRNCLITEGHLLDGSFGVEIGNRTWVAGRNSSFWSHGSTSKPGPILIGEKCYIGSDVKVGTNISIGDEVLIAMGSVVMKGCPSNCSLVGVPAVVKKENYTWHENWGG